jgi:uncharacterized protein (TIGR03118 family)
MIKLVSRRVGLAAFLAFAVSAAAPAVHAGDGHHDGDDNRYVVTNLVSDIAKLGGKIIDPNLKNAWGVTFTPSASPFWISDNASGLSTLYDGDGTIVSLVVTIPCPPNPPGAGQGSSCPPSPPPTNAAPTGMVWNPTTSLTTGFLVPGTNPSVAATFIWATEDGTISAWTGGLQNNKPPLPADNAVLAVNNSLNPNAMAGAVYKGLVAGVNANGVSVTVNGVTGTDFVLLYTTNFRAGTVEVYGPARSNDSTTGFYVPVTTDGNFTDPDIPPGYSPFGIQNINGDLFVTYAKQNAAKHDDVAGKGNGFVDVFDTDGHLKRRFASRGALNSPWGVARASFAFGRFSGDILVGNFGDGRINVFDSDGNFLGQLRDTNGKPLSIDGLWTLTLGGGAKSSPDTLYFTAGPNGETDGLFGTITPAQDIDDN